NSSTGALTAVPPAAETNVTFRRPASVRNNHWQDSQTTLDRLDVNTLSDSLCNPSIKKPFLSSLRWKVATAVRGDHRVIVLLQQLAAALFAIVLFLSSMYCLLAYIPTPSFAFIRAPFQTWMPLFASLQPYLFAITFCAAATSPRGRVAAAA